MPHRVSRLAERLMRKRWRPGSMPVAAIGDEHAAGLHVAGIIFDWPVIDLRVDWHDARHRRIASLPLDAVCAA